MPLSYEDWRTFGGSNGDISRKTYNKLYKIKTKQKPRKPRPVGHEESLYVIIREQVRDYWPPEFHVRERRFPETDEHIREIRLSRLKRAQPIIEPYYSPNPQAVTTYRPQPLPPLFPPPPVNDENMNPQFI